MECDGYSDADHQKWAEKFIAIPANELSFSFRTTMSRYLDHSGDHATFSSQGVLQNWMGLAECMGFSNQTISHLESSKSPTMSLLEKWENFAQNTIKDLILLLLEMERYDILEIPEARRQLELHIRNYQRRRANVKPVSPIQDATVDSSYRPGCIAVPEANYSSPYRRRTDHHVDETKYLTTWEGYYDAFISYSKGDWWFIRHLIDALESEPYNQRLCIADRDILAGNAEMSAIATLVTKRCRRVVVVLSPNFVECPMCDFTVKYTASLSPGARSKKMIPVMIQECDSLPPIITFITMLHYTKDDSNRWFWDRLAMSLTVPLEPSDVQVDKSVFADTCLMKCEDLSGKESEKGPVVEESIKSGGKKEGPPPSVSADELKLSKERKYVPGTSNMETSKHRPSHSKSSGKAGQAGPSGTPRRAEPVEHSSATPCTGDMSEETSPGSSQTSSPSPSIQSLPEVGTEATEHPSGLSGIFAKFKRKKKEKVAG